MSPSRLPKRKDPGEVAAQAAAVRKTQQKKQLEVSIRLCGHQELQVSKWRNPEPYFCLFWGLDTNQPHQPGGCHGRCLGKGEGGTGGKTAGDQKRGRKKFGVKPCGGWNNWGTPKSSILIEFSIIFTIHFGVSLFLETPIYIYIYTSTPSSRGAFLKPSIRDGEGRGYK